MLIKKERERERERGVEIRLIGTLRVINHYGNKKMKEE